MSMKSEAEIIRRRLKPLVQSLGCDKLNDPEAVIGF